MLAAQNFSLKVVDLPRLNGLDEKWLEITIENCQTILALENHSEHVGIGDLLLDA